MAKAKKTPTTAPVLKAQGTTKKRTPQSAFDPAAGKDIYEPEKIVAQRIVKGGATQYHVKWERLATSSSTTPGSRSKTWRCNPCSLRSTHPNDDLRVKTRCFSTPPLLFLRGNLLVFINTHEQKETRSEFKPRSDAEIVERINT